MKPYFNWATNVTPSVRKDNFGFDQTKARFFHKILNKFERFIQLSLILAPCFLFQ